MTNSRSDKHAKGNSLGMNMDTDTSRTSSFRHIVGEVLHAILFGFLLFVPAGTFHWPRAWIFLGVLIVVRIVSSLTLLRLNRALMVERSKFPVQQGQPLADKLLLPAFMAAFAGLVVFTSLDRFRWRFLNEPSTIVSAGGLLMFVAGWGLVTAALGANTFASTVVRYQNERDHRVIDLGVYKIVRHPMYAGLALDMIGMCLWLGSLAGALLASVPIGILVVRIHIEEQVLRRNLDGYDIYISKVPRRLVPGIW
jgi:protein-S-isoprenylcysteine O-methyltransferase Ste14